MVAGLVYELTDKDRAQIAEDLLDLQKLTGVAHMAAMQIESAAHMAGFPLTGAIKEALGAITDTLGKTQEHQMRLGGLLHRSGVAVPSRKTAPVSDLAMLATMDTEDSRELLRLLEAAQAVAEKIDRSRGKSLDESVQVLPGESHGTDLAESVSMIALRVRTEIRGRAGKGLE